MHALGEAVPKARKWCRVCFETPFEQFFGFESQDGKIFGSELDSPEDDMCSVCSDDETDKKVESLMSQVHQRAHSLWPGPGELKKIISEFRRCIIHNSITFLPFS